MAELPAEATSSALYTVMTSFIASHMTPAFYIGALVIAVYAWQQFDEPSFPSQETLPRTVVPLRYLFLKPSYRRARLVYVAASLTLYCLIVWAGQAILPKDAFGKETVTPENWPLLAALVLVGIVPNLKVKWLAKIEEQLRRGVHAWFLVPAGVERVIGILEDASFDPSPSQLNLIPEAQRNRVKAGLAAPRGSLPYRWSRATVLVASLKNAGAGGMHVLRQSAFDPFQEDFRAILERYQALRVDVEALGDSPANGDAEESMANTVDVLLKRMYAYASWGIRYQSNSDRDVNRTLAELGFRVPPTGDRRLFDIVVPAVLLIAVISMIHSVIAEDVSAMFPQSDLLTGGASTGGKSGTLVTADTIKGAVSSAIASSLMFGAAVWLALQGRSNQIERKVWRQASARRLAPIAFRAGLATWAIIVLSTVLVDPTNTILSLQSLMRPWQFGPDSASTAWFLPGKMLTATPWLLVGGTVSVVLCHQVGGDVRRANRLRDAAILGACAALAAVIAALIQGAFDKPEAFDTGAPYVLAGLSGLAGLACGGAIGFTVPWASMADLKRPFDTAARRALVDLLRQAEITLGTKAAAENWVFMPRDELDGITPAEAIRYKGYATGAVRLLDEEAVLCREGEERAGHGMGPSPVVIQGGRAVGGSV